MLDSCSDTPTIRIPVVEMQCQQGKCHNKARFIKRFLTEDKAIKAFRFCSKHLSTEIKGYRSQDFNLISS
jgi:hypothetical protein